MGWFEVTRGLHSPSSKWFPGKGKGKNKYVGVQKVGTRLLVPESLDLSWMAEERLSCHDVEFVEGSLSGSCVGRGGF